MQKLLYTGIAVPVILAIAIISAGFAQPGYSHAKDLISLLGAKGAPLAGAVNGAFMISGLIMMVFAYGLHKALPEGSVVGPALIGLSGTGMVILGSFPCEPGCAADSLASNIHRIGARTVGFGMIFAVLFTTGRIPNKKLDLMGIAVVAISGLLGLALTLILLPGFVTLPISWLESVQPGILQRVSMGLPLLWLAVTGYWLAKKG